MNTLLLVLLLQNPVQDTKWEKISHISIAAMNIAQFADLSTTMYMSGKGGFEEANPLLKSFEHSPISMALVKGGLATLSSYLLIRMHKKHPKLVIVTSSLIAIGTGYIAYRNSQLLERSK